MTPNQKNSDEVCETPAAESNVQLEPHTATLGEARGTVLENLHGAEQALQAAQQQRQHPSGSIVVIAAPAAPQLAPWQGIPQELRERAQWDNIPEDLRYTPKWVVAGPDKAPYSPNGHRASVTNPATWTDFYSAATTAATWGADAGVGFILSEEDPFTCIDLDVKDSTTQEELDRFWAIIQYFNSYTEFSRSGRGIHIWVKGKVGPGTRRDGVEVYSQARYIICTGNPLPGFNKPIEPRQHELDRLLEGIRRGAASQETVLVEVETDITDDELWSRASTAGNAEKFLALFNVGDWAGLGYPSQSEADLSLMSMLCFYSKSNDQCRRVFRFSALGKRAKAVKNDVYLNRTLRIVRSRQECEDERATSIEAKSAGLVQHVRATSAAQPGHLGNPIDLRPHAPPAETNAQLAWPPGFAGAIATFIYQSAPRPVAEVAIVGALGLLAGICGRRWIVSNSGLNLYLILVARSAIGKEAMHTGIGALIKAATKKAPDAGKFVNFADFASGPALVKAVAKNSCFVNVAGEFGHKFAKMAKAKEGADHTLRGVLTNLYSKSGPQSIAGGISYSDTEKNADVNNDIAYSLVGETTPGTFYEAITHDMMADGFLSRFTVIAYEGDRPEKNQSPQLVPPEQYVDHLANLVMQAVQHDVRNVYQDVDISPDADRALAAFEYECDTNIRKAGDDESRRAMWNRAHLKALRVSSLLAVADNCQHPSVTTVYVEWAIDLVRRDIAMFSKRLRSGGIGDDDKARERTLLEIIKNYLLEEPTPGYKVKPALHKNSIVPRKYLQQRTSSLSAFKNHKMGATIAIEQVLRSLCSSGYVTKCDSVMMIKTYGEHGDCYKVLDLPLDD